VLPDLLAAIRVLLLRGGEGNGGNGREEGMERRGKEGREGKRRGGWREGR